LHRLFRPAPMLPDRGAARRRDGRGEFHSGSVRPDHGAQRPAAGRHSFGDAPGDLRSGVPLRRRRGMTSCRVPLKPAHPERTCWGCPQRFCGTATLTGISEAEALLKATPIFSRLTPADRHTIADASRVQRYEKGELIFEQESPSDAFYAIASGRVKIFKMMPNGKDLILEVFGPGDPLG